ncbi:unnamed protein product [Vitrella brassicaformis CCMP3155]|uniref:Uncharacterized protein n=2 Tax=Vitrella brassicaformis TaxID=1169539 RepID=A0A0G4EU53_VITBC|nr:unnamed protein product [Vitrella brassicaformis CCMP3155]|eukprot:CEM02173.1 unnamed protein product [Vitrella brassicaformis CCMP3155]
MEGGKGEEQPHRSVPWMDCVAVYFMCIALVVLIILRPSRQEAPSTWEPASTPSKLERAQSKSDLVLALDAVLFIFMILWWPAGDDYADGSMALVLARADGSDQFGVPSIYAAVNTAAITVALMDDTPEAVAWSTLGSVFSRLINRNTTIPTKMPQVFSTAAYKQTQVGIKSMILGERVMAAANEGLGRCELLVGIPRPPDMEVTLATDAKGILHMWNAHHPTGHKQDIVIQSWSGGLSDVGIRNMVQDAEPHSDLDQRRREAMTVKNDAESLTLERHIPARRATPFAMHTLSSPSCRFPHRRAWIDRCLHFISVSCFED